MYIYIYIHKVGSFKVVFLSFTHLFGKVVVIQTHLTKVSGHQQFKDIKDKVEATEFLQRTENLWARV